jgi:hypothetical protein
VSPDLPDNPDGPPDRRNDHDGGQAAGVGRSRAETRSRMEYYVALRAEVAAEETAAAQRASAREQAAAEKWQEKLAESRWIWEEYRRKWPPDEHVLPDRSGDQVSSRGDRGWSLDNAANSRVEMECDRIAVRERDKISPALLATESQDPDRHLIGFEHRLKERDRIKDKVHDKMEEFGFSPEEAVSNVSDTIRYTFQYREDRYTQGVWSDIGRLKERGFELRTLKNFWSAEEYKGVNSQWIEPDTGQRFEVQFHTRISFEGKQLTHGAYEKLRIEGVDEFEKMVLKAFQRKVSADIPIPPGVANIDDYPEGGGRVVR